MKPVERLRNPEKKDGAGDDILWPFVYWPLIWILLIHVGTRVMWFIGYK